MGEGRIWHWKGVTNKWHGPRLGLFRPLLALTIGCPKFVSLDAVIVINFRCRYGALSYTYFICNNETFRSSWYIVQCTKKILS